MPERPGCLPDPIIHCLGPFWLHQDFRLFRKIHSCSTPAQKVTSLHFTTLCSKPFSLCFSLVQILTSSVSFFFFFKLFKSLVYFDNVPIFCFNISIEFVSRIFFSIPCKLALGKYNLISEFIGTEVSMILHSIWASILKVHLAEELGSRVQNFCFLSIHITPRVQSMKPFIPSNWPSPYLVLFARLWIGSDSSFS